MNVRYFEVGIVCIILLGSVIPIFSIGTEAAAGREIYVDASAHLFRDGTAENPYKTIKEALSYANDGDAIYVFGGTYNETGTEGDSVGLYINKRVTLVGSISDGNSVITCRRLHTYNIEITADYVTLEGFNITDSENYISDIGGALIHITGNNVIIQQNNISKSRYGWGIYLDSSSGHVIGGNRISYLKSGVYISGSNTNDFLNNHIYEGEMASVEMYSSSNNRFYNNSLNASEYGIYAKTCNNINITNNSIFNNNLHGIALYQGSDAVVQENHIYNNAVEGIHLNAAGSKIIENHLNENQIGMNLDQSSCEIWGNIINNSQGTGILGNVGSRNNVIYWNHLNNDTPNAHEKGLNDWDHNYWDNYNEVDRDKDGVGDTPYNIVGGAKDHYPLGVFQSPPNKPDTPTPADDAENVGLRVTLKVRVSDPNRDLMKVSFYDASDNRLLGFVINVYSTRYASFTMTLPFDKTFAWYAIANDTRQENRSDIWFFTTKQRPPTNKKPVANPSGPYTSGIDIPVTFDASGSSDPDGSIIFYRWNFGDGTSQILSMNPTHTYSNPGRYTVTLTVVDNDGRSTTANTTATILVNYKRSPVAIIDSASSATVDKALSFNGSRSYSPDGTIIEYRWDFQNDSVPDTAWLTTPEVSYTFTVKGNYTAKLEVKDSNGNIGSTTKLIIVVPAVKKTPGFEMVLALLVIALVAVCLRWRNKH